MNNPEELHTKRKTTATNFDYQPPVKRFHDHHNHIHNNTAAAAADFDDQDDSDFLTLSLSFNPSRPKKSPPSLPPRPPPRTQVLLPLEENLDTPSPLQLSSSHSILNTPPTPPPQSFYVPPPSSQPPVPGPSRAPRQRRNPTQALRDGKSETIPAPFPWATTRRATVHTLETILERGIKTITGEVQCKKCEKQYELGFGLKEKFAEVGRFIAENKSSMHDRAPSVWMNPVLPSCKYCEQENSVKPVIADKKKEINWLFLLLGQMLGCCTLEQLKYFCKHTKNHRTGAKDRVLFLTYLGLCKQLQPDGPFNLR